MIVRLIGLEHSEWDKIKESIGVGNQTKVVHQPEWDKPEGRAYAVFYGGFHLGYIPLVPTLRKFYHEATGEGKKRLEDWGTATKQVRLWLDSKVKYNFEEEWEIPVWEILFKDENGYNTKDKGVPAQISLMFEEVG